MASLPRTTRREALSALYEKAWKKEWPFDEKTLQPESEGTGAEHKNITDRFAYQCVRDVHEVARAIGAPPPLYGPVVVCREYEVLLRELMVGELKDERQSVVVAGHPGIGASSSPCLRRSGADSS